MKGRNVNILSVLLLGLGLLCTSQSLASTPFDQLRISRELAGTIMPPFELQTLDGTSVRSSSLRGKVVLLNFWATWCGPCKDEMPALGRLKKHFEKEDFLLLTITTDQQPHAIRSFLNILNVDFPVLLDDSREVSVAYRARALPFTVLIGKDGQLLGKAMGPREWDSPASIALITQLLD